MLEIKPGKYEARVCDYGIKATKAGDPAVVVRFKTETFEYNWQGTLKEGRGREITIDALLVCGLSTDDLTQLADGVDSKVLDTEKLVSITVELERNTNDGKDYPKIAWVNELGGGGFKNEMTKEQAVAKMSGMNLKADVLKRRQEKGVTKPAASRAANGGQPLDAIPF